MTAGGVLVVDKPAGWTSHDVVARGRRLNQTRRVGHAGTLDPMATGVLILGVGPATKLLTFLVGADKTYTATIRLGESTVTDDAEGEVTQVRDAAAITDTQIQDGVARLTGAIQQVPSAVSAIKIKGVRSYTRVRNGEDVDLPARPVTVSAFAVHEIRRSATTEGNEGNESRTLVDLDVEVTVSSGTYIRALARDLGADLGVGGHLTALRRTRVGPFQISEAAPLADLEALREADQPLPLISLAQAASRALPVRELTEKEAADVGHGRPIPARPASALPASPEAVAALGPDGSLVAVLDESGERVRSHVVMPR
ncbi:tRNA pseudouridine(55) synthase TruB [Dermacoccaceae bacterium W4C1]